MTTKLPFLKFYTTDWRSDPRLRMCSASARGVWIEMICLMHEAKPYGHLLVSGQPPNEAQLASLTGIPSSELSDGIAELENMGVFSRTKEGVIYSRKLTTMKAKSAKARINGKKGGSPRLCKQTKKEGSLNLEDKGQDKPQRLEARDQKEKEEPSGSSKKKRASRLPDDWELPKDWGEWALSEGVDELTVRREADKFRDWWHAKSGREATKLDWKATWRNWIRNAIDRGMIRVRGSPAAPPVSDEIRKLQAQHQAEQAERKARQ